MSGSRSIGSLIVELAARGAAAYKAAVDQAAAATDQAEKSSKKLGNTLDQQANAANLASAATNVLASAAKYAATAFAAWKVVDMVRDSAMAAARFETMGVVMKVAGNNAGYSGQQMQEFSKQLQASGISMMQSRNALTQLATANIDLSQASKLARAAQDLAVVGNVNSSEALGRLIAGIKSGEVEVLKSLGLNVSFEASYKKLATQLGTTSDKLTEQQKLLARTDVSLESAARYTGIYEESMSTASKQMKSMERYVDDLGTTFGSVFNEALTIGVMGLANALKEGNKEVTNLAENDKLKDWGNDVADVFAFTADAAISAISIFQIAGKQIGYIAARTALFMTSNPQNKAQLDSYNAAKNAMDEAYEADMTRLRGQTSAMRDALAQRRKVLADDANAQSKDRLATRSERDARDALAAQAEADARRQAGLAAGAKAAAKSLKDEADLLARLSGYNADYEEQIQRLTAAKNSGRLALDRYNDEVVRLVKLQPGAVAAEKASIEAAKANTDAVDELFDAQEKLRLQNEDQIKTGRTMLEQIEFETRLLDMNTQQRAIATLERELERQGIVKGTQAYDAYIAKLREAVAIKDAKEAGIESTKALADANRKAAEESSKYWEDALMRAFESGKGFFQSLWDTIKNTLQTQVLKVLVTGTLTGVSALADAATGGLSSSLLGSAGGSLLGSAAAGGAGTVSSLLMSPGMGALDIGGFALAGPAGLALAAAAAVAAIFGNKKTPSAGTGEGNVTFDASGAPISASSRYSGAWGLTDTVQATLSSLYSDYAKAARALGISTVQAEFGFGGNTGKEGKDPQFALGVNAGGVSYSSGEIKLTDANVQLAASRAVFAALQGSDLPEYLKGAFDDLMPANATQEQIEATLSQAASVKTFHEAVQKLPFDSLKNLGFEATMALGDASGGLDVLVNTLTDVTNASATARAGIQALIDGIDTKVSGSIFDMQYGMEDNAGKYSMLDVRAARLNDQMLASTDISAIAAMAEDQIALINQAWGLLSDEQQKAKYLEFEDRLQKIDDYVTTRGADAISLQQAADDKTAATIAAAVEAAVEKAMATSAAAMQAVADKTEKPIEVTSNVNLTVTAPVGSEVAINA